MTVDTACSSSLVTTHLAAKARAPTLRGPGRRRAAAARRRGARTDAAPRPALSRAAQGLELGECEAAGSVGVNLTLAHSWTRACLRAGMLSEEGRCKTLDSSAGACAGWGRLAHQQVSPARERASSAEPALLPALPGTQTATCAPRRSAP